MASKRIAFWSSRAGRAGKVAVTVQGGVRMYLHFDSDFCRLVYRGCYEVGERHFVNALLRSGDVFVDVGANIGLYTVTAARLVGRGGLVHAFEPCAETFERLQENVRFNNARNVTLHRAGLSNAGGTARLNVAKGGFDAWNSLCSPTAGTELGVEEIQVNTWDEFVRSQGLQEKVTLAKVDIEGWEARFLAGGQETLSRDDAPTLLVEFSEAAAEGAGSSLQELYLKLKQLGYGVYRYEIETRRLTPQPMQTAYQDRNLIATKRLEEVHDRLRKGPRFPRML